MRNFITDTQMEDFLEELETMDAEIVKGAILDYLKDISKTIKRNKDSFTYAENRLKDFVSGNGDECDSILSHTTNIEANYERVISPQSRFTDLSVSIRLYNEKYATDKADNRVHIENLNQLKKALCKGARFNIIHNEYKPEWDGQKRIVQATQSNCIYSGIYEDKTHEISTANNGKGSRLDLDNTSEWEFENGTCKCFSEWETWENGQRVTKRKQWLTLEVIA